MYLYFLAGNFVIGEFICNNNRSIDHNLTCNSINDCGDWSDETNCKGDFVHILCQVITFAKSFAFNRIFDRTTYRIFKISRVVVNVTSTSFFVRIKNASQKGGNAMASMIAEIAAMNFRAFVMVIA